MYQTHRPDDYRVRRSPEAHARRLFSAIDQAAAQPTSPDALRLISMIEICAIDLCDSVGVKIGRRGA